MPLDVAIVGAGPVGAALAARLAPSGVSIALFEARASRGNDARTLALSHASREWLDELGAWPAAAATPIESIHVSQRGAPGRTLIEAREQGLAALGYTVSFGDLQAAIGARLASVGADVRFGHACERIELHPDKATLGFEGGAEVEARLVVLADGGANAARIPGLAFEERDYRHSALVAAVHVDRPHGGRAYERFTTEGPMALLPVADRYALVWTGDDARVAQRLALPDAQFLEALQASFGDRAGRFRRVGHRGSFALKLRVANSPIALRTAIIGNAAQSLHPVAGQGLNLGLRDAAQLAALIESSPPDEMGGLAMLQRYRESRRRDASRGVAFTDLLVAAFGARGRLPALGRGLALAGLDLFPPARRVFGDRMIHGAPAW